MSKKKWVVGGLAISAGPALVAMGAVGLVVAMVMGLMVTVVGGGLGAMFGDKSIQSQYGQFGCADTGPGGPGVPVSGSQTEYVRTVIGIAKTMKVNEKGQIIAVMTMLQESTIQNYANSGQNRLGYDGFPAPGTQYWLNVAKLSLKYPHDAVGNDADSVGLFQQRASAGWADDAKFKASNNPDAAIKRLLDPRWGAQQFFGGEGGSPNRGMLDISGWESMAHGSVAQKVQGSAFPDAYNKWQSEASTLVQSNSDAPAIPLLGGGGGGGGGSTTPPAGEEGPGGNAVQYPMAEGTYTISSGFGPRNSPGGVGSTNHRGLDFAAPLGTPIYSPADGTVAAAGAASGFGQWVVIDHVLNGKKVSTVYGHVTAASIKVTKGQKVKKGQQIAGIGNEGASTGPHLHFEVWPLGRFDGGQPIDPAPWLGGNYTSGGAEEATCNGGGSPISASGTVPGIFEAWDGILGTPYSWGGGALTGPTEGFAQGAGIVGFDCSSATQYAVYHGTGGDNGGLTLPRTAGEQYNFSRGTTVWSPGQSTDKLQPGDLLFYGSSTSNITHVAMYIGNGEMYEAPRTGVDVRKAPLRTSTMVAATRLELSDDSSSETSTTTKGPTGPGAK